MHETLLQPAASDNTAHSAQGIHCQGHRARQSARASNSSPNSACGSQSAQRSVRHTPSACKSKLAGQKGQSSHARSGDGANKTPCLRPCTHPPVQTRAPTEQTPPTHGCVCLVNMSTPVVSPWYLSHQRPLLPGGLVILAARHRWYTSHAETAVVVQGVVVNFFMLQKRADKRRRNSTLRKGSVHVPQPRQTDHT